jgi:DNA mismatch repair protein MutS
MSEIIQPNSTKPVVSYEYSEDMGHYIDITNNRLNIFMSKVNEPLLIETSGNQYNVNINEFNINKNRSGKNCKITSPDLSKRSVALVESQKNLLKKVIEVYHLFLHETNTEYEGLMKRIVNFVAYLDFYKSNAKTSLLYNYCRPRTINDHESAHLMATSLRHPLIEQIQEQFNYIPQDLLFDKTQSGILLFGINKAGKSSLMKAVGISVILAQSGLFVPASEFTFRPYNFVLTRIVGTDNILRGQSSFDVEMVELRGILRRADQNALILGDEICHGTETISGVSIVASSIITLSGLSCNFIFATHLHQLVKLKRINELNNLKMYHLKVKFDQSTGNLVYDRHLEPGPGQSIYGLEVAKAMNLDPSFIELANGIRREIMGIEDQVLPVKKSKYNKHIYINKCGIPDCPNKAEATHHIQFQSRADETGFIDHMNKNHKSNLIPLCRSCHDMLHDEQPGHYRYIIRGYMMTSDGTQLDYEKILNPSVDKFKFKFKFPLKLKQN